MNQVIGGAPGPGSTIGLLGAQLNSSIQEDLFVAGKAFSYEDYHTFGSSEVKNFIFDPTLFSGTQLVFNPITFQGSSGPLLIDFYTDTVANSDGTTLQASNRREGMPNPKSIIRLNPTGLTLGTRFAGDSVPATGAGVGNTNGSGNMPGLPFEIDFSKKHAFKITNTAGGETIVQIKMTWFEV